MTETKITIRDLTKTWTCATGERHIFRLSPLRAYLVEMEDLHFHFDSAVVMPDQNPADAKDARSGSDITSFAVMRAVYRHAAAHPDQQLLSAGHTDRSGTTAYNEKLSSLRAKNVRAALMGQRDEWTRICLEKHVVEDYQLILKWIANVRYWPDCDPGPVDGIHGDGTSRALRAFKKRYNSNFGGTLADTDIVDKASWDAFFHLYMLALAALMQTDEQGLQGCRSALKWYGPAEVGCGEAHPITPELRGNYRSPVDRRVELLFFEPGEEPDLGKCHPTPTTCAPKQCELYGAGTYIISPIDVVANAKVALRLSEIRGLYKPGYNDPGDVTAGQTKGAGYLKGYKSEDDAGRIFVNQIPRTAASADWEGIKKKNQQYIELVATVDVREGVLPPDSRVVWEWSDPDDPSDAGMRDDAAEDVDPNDFKHGKRTGEKGDDNFGNCDYPSPNASKHAVFQQVGAYTLAADATSAQRCFTLIAGGKSEVRFHCTDAGGDNFRMKATVAPAPGVVVTAGDATGIMTVWKRIDVECRRMQHAEPIPVKDIVPYFEKQFVQMDVEQEQLTTSDLQYLSKTGKESDYTNFIKNEFKHKDKPGWFFVCSARESEPPKGKARRTLYEGPARLVENVSGNPGEISPIAGYIVQPPNHESLVIDAGLADAPEAVTFFEGGKQIVFSVRDVEADTPAVGKTTLTLRPIDFQSDFEAGNGSLKKAYENRAFYFPRFRYRWPEDVWEKKGYAFPEHVYVNIRSKGSSITAGTSPDQAGHFAGRTIVFTRHPAYTKPASAAIDVRGKWVAGDLVQVTIAGTTASYTVAAHDLVVPAGTTDRDLYIRGQIAIGLQNAIDDHPALSAVYAARASFGRVRVSTLAAGGVGNGTPILAAPGPAAGRSGWLELSSPALVGGGFDDSARQDIVTTITHELGHAFGFPHKCGYRTFEAGEATSCTMNYYQNWLYQLGTQRDASARRVERFGTGKEGKHFCALHTLGIRRVRLEDNPAIWTW